MQRRGLFRGSKVNTTPNTFIGGVASTIPDSATLATKLGIPESKIGSFEVCGNDIKAAVNAPYTLPRYTSSTFGNYTYFRDLGGNLTEFGSPNIGIPSSCEILEFYSATYHGYNPSNWSYPSDSQIKIMYFPNVLNWGDSHGQEDPYQGTRIFRFSAAANARIYVHPSMATSNNGGLEGDLAYAQSTGAVIRYVSDFTKPSEITDLSYTTNGTDVTLTFTPPSSTNALDFYQVYVNGCYKEEITGSGAVISGLNNGDKVTVYACDEYYNRSISNEVTISGI
jgi:hypothetical protein